MAFANCNVFVNNTNYNTTLLVFVRAQNLKSLNNFDEY